MVILIDFNKLEKAYNDFTGSKRLGDFLEIAANEIEVCFAKQVNDDTWNTILDFCLSFPEWCNRDSCYDGRHYHIIGGINVYEEDIQRLLYQGKRKPMKKIYEVCNTLDEFIKLIEENK